MDTAALFRLFNTVFGEPPGKIDSIDGHASERHIFRLCAGARTAVGVINSDIPENLAFIGFARHFRSVGLPVPEIYAVEPDGTCYLEEDLGDSTLLDVLKEQQKEDGTLPASSEALYRAALETLPRFQVQGAKGLDYSLCYQGRTYNLDAMVHDTDYFQQSFLARMGVEYDSARLVEEFKSLADFLSRAKCEFFMYRDFQARNIMVKNGAPWFIDFQSGRRGPLQYDVASLLYQSNARLPEELRAKLLSHYLNALRMHIAIDESEFMRYLPGFVVIRLLQALGAYGRAGLERGKSYFSASIPLAVANLASLLPLKDGGPAMPELKAIAAKLQK